MKLSAWLVGFGLACMNVGAAPRQALAPGPFHLGIAGLAEWQEFESSSPHGRQLDLGFEVEDVEREHTLLVRQRDVKTSWAVTLNGTKLGELEKLTQPLVLALRVPAGTLRVGENRLNLTRAPSPMLDDIVVSDLVLVAQPREELLGAAGLEVAVVDSTNGERSPCRITIVDASGALMPFQAAPGQPLALRTGVIYTGDGRARVSLAAGEYLVHASRGFEFSVASATVALEAGAQRTVSLQIRREVPTPGLIACDTHLHTLTHSRHGDATVEERMLTIAGEGIELAVATDHNHHADYTAPARQMGVAKHFTPVVGNEVTTRIGHFNAFPVRVEDRVPDTHFSSWPELLHHVRTVTGARVITLNHPRDLHSGFVPFGPANFDERTGELRGVPEFPCDAIEVVTSAAMQSDILQLYRDWFALLNHGYRVAAVGASDTHHVSEFIVGQARTYVVARDADAGAVDLEEVWESFRRGRMLVSMGLLTTLRVDGRFSSGDLATGSGDRLRVEIDVLGPSWVHADRVELYANGVKVREQEIAATSRVEKARLRWELPRPRHDLHLVAIATGPGVRAPWWDTPKPYQASSKIFTPRVIGSTNPVWIDGDGDGRFTPARGYAARILEQTEGNPAQRQRTLADFDGAVALQLADLVAKRRAGAPQ